MYIPILCTLTYTTTTTNNAVTTTTTTSSTTNNGDNLVKVFAVNRNVISTLLVAIVPSLAVREA